MFWRSVPQSTSEQITASLAEWVTPAALSAARTQSERPSIEAAFGSGEAELIALMMGLKPLVRQLLSPVDFQSMKVRGLPQGIVFELGTNLFGGRNVVFLSREQEVARAAVRAEDEQNHEALGALLGYPKCCVQAFREIPEKRSWMAPETVRRTNLKLMEAAAARTAGRPFAPRLNTLDLGMFHYLAWWPCTFDCAPSGAYADAVAAALSRRHGGWLSFPTNCIPGCKHEVFVRAIDSLLSAHRLVLLEEVQVSMRGQFEGDTLQVTEAWPTFRDRSPGSVLGAAAREAAIHLAAAATLAGEVRLKGDELLLGGKKALRCPGALLAPFGSP